MAPATEGTWHAEVLIPAHRLVLALVAGEVVELRGSSSHGTFRAYRGLPDAVHGMIAWPNTVLLTGPRTIVVDPGYQTQGDMLAGALKARGLDPEQIDTVVMTHLHSDHLSALPQLGEVDLHLHRLELDETHARRQQGLLDAVRAHPFEGEEGEILPGLTWVHTPGHSAGHVVLFAETPEGTVAIAGDTLGPDPSSFADDDLPEGFPERDLHLQAFAKVRRRRPAVLIPGHNPPVRL